jgi:hypothetical protein
VSECSVSGEYAHARLSLQVDIDILLQLRLVSDCYPTKSVEDGDQQCDEMRCSIIWRPEDNQFHKLNGESIRDMIRALCLTRNHILPGTEAEMSTLASRRPMTIRLLQRWWVL